MIAAYHVSNLCDLHDMHIIPMPDLCWFQYKQHASTSMESPPMACSVTSSPMPVECFADPDANKAIHLCDDKQAMSTIAEFMSGLLFHGFMCCPSGSKTSVQSGKQLARGCCQKIWRPLKLQLSHALHNTSSIIPFPSHLQLQFLPHSSSQAHCLGHR